MSVCRAIVHLDGTNYPCDLSAPHPGVAHVSADAEVVWCSDGEARAAKKKAAADAK